MTSHAASTLITSRSRIRTVATMAALPLHETLNVYVSSAAYVFEPASGAGAKSGGLVDEKDARESLVIDRQTGGMALSSTNEVPLGREKIITCYGILGILTLATTDYILIITGRNTSCRLLSHPIYTATDYRLLPLASHASSAKLLDHPIERELIQLVEHGLKGSRLWFSYGWDLTSSLQRQEKYHQGPMWQKADERFFWNRFLVQRMIDQTESGGPDLSRFILPVMFGSLELRSSTINNRDVLFCLISRRSRHRAGTRYFTRGINSAGDCANYNETEQILLLDPLPVKARGRVDGIERLSFVQTRGSIPIFWAEVNNLRYKPDLQIMDVPETTAALTAHLRAQFELYGPVNLVNLINQHGHEHPVKAAFEAAIAAASEHDDLIARNARYTYFDFHKECKGLRFDRVSVLVDRLAKDLDAMGYYHTTADKQSKKQQVGIIRSNCMDCLDRTNVVQAALGKFTLERQLKDVGVLAQHEMLDVKGNEEFIAMFRNVWADHADYISKAYSGTGALKTDYTRTGKRTKEGALQDGVNSIMRYVRNNFFDGDRQDAYDILTGAWVGQRGAVVPLMDTRPLFMRWMPYVLAFALTLWFTTAIVPSSSSIVSLKWLWILMAISSMVYIWGNGVSYVSWPRLNPPVETLSYKGAGFRTASRGRGLSFTKLGKTILKRGQSAAAKTRAKAGEVELGKRKAGLID